MKKIRKRGCIFPDIQVKSDEFSPLKDFSGETILVRPPVKPQKVDVLPVSQPEVKTRSLSDLEISAMDERNAEIDEITSEFILKMIGASPHDMSIEDVGIDPEMLCKLEDAFEQALADEGIFVFRPTLVSRPDGEHILRSAFTDDELEVPTPAYEYDFDEFDT